MRIEFLGTGTSFGVPQVGCDCDVCQSDDRRDARLRSSIWVQDGSLSLVVDTGPDFRAQCLRSNITRLDAVFYTHFHADHIFGLDDVRVYNYLQKSDISVYLPDFMSERFEQCFAYTTEEAKPGLTRPQFKIHPVNYVPIPIGSLHVEPVDVDHGDEQVKGYIFSAGGRKFAYLTDCKSLPAKSIDAVRGSDVVVLSALWSMDKTHPGHMNLEEALAMAKVLRGGQTYLTHITHHMGLHEQVQPTLPPAASLAYDGLSINL